jgi:hypothetical protein
MADASSRQLFMGSPSTRTVHTPQSPTLQPFLVPVRCSASRSTSSSVCPGATATVRGSPLIVSVRVVVTAALLAPAGGPSRSPGP